MGGPLRVLIADDSGTARQLLTHIVNDSTELSVVGLAEDGHQAVHKTHDLKPDVILMDMLMPGLDGLEATREIMHSRPTPIVVISAALEGRETEVAFQALRLGALTVLPKPKGPGDPDFARQSQNIRSTLRAMAGVRVIHHWKADKASRPKPQGKPSALLAPPEIVGIVASTGGPAALSEIFKRLPVTFPLPIVVVQHIANDFLPSLIGWLSQITPLHVELANVDVAPLPGCVYVAPGGVHLMLNRQRRFVFDHEDTSRPHMPSGDVMLDSIADTYGAAAVGVVLTGMGSDGAHGLLKLFKVGALTIAQDEGTSAVYGMPREAARLSAANHILPLTGIPSFLMETVGQKADEKK